MSWRIYVWRGPLEALTLAPAEARDDPGTDLPPTTPDRWPAKRHRLKGVFRPGQVEAFLRDQGVLGDPAIHGGCVADNIHTKTPMMFSRFDGGNVAVVGVVPVSEPLG